MMKSYRVSVLYYEGNGDCFEDETWKDFGVIPVEAKNVKKALKKVQKNLHTEATVPEDERKYFKTKGE